MQFFFDLDLLGLHEVLSIAEEVRTDVFDTVGFDESGGNLFNAGPVVFKYGRGFVHQWKTIHLNDGMLHSV